MSPKQEVDEIMEMAEGMQASVLMLTFIRPDGTEYTSFALATKAVSAGGESVALDETEGMDLGLKTFTVVKR